MDSFAYTFTYTLAFVLLHVSLFIATLVGDPIRHCFSLCWSNSCCCLFNKASIANAPVKQNVSGKIQSLQSLLRIKVATITTALSNKDENLLWAMLHWHRSRHSKKWRRYLFLLVALFLGIWSFLFHSCSRALCTCSFNTFLLMPHPSLFFSIFWRPGKVFPFVSFFFTSTLHACNPQGSRYSYSRVEPSLCFKARI